MKIRLFCLLMVTVLCLPFCGCAAEPTAQETPYVDFRYGMNEDGVYISRYVGMDKHIVIPAEIDGNPVFSISLNAFMGQDIESVVIPDSVTEIREAAFQGCKNLKRVEFGDGLKTINSRAFYGCTTLEAIHLPDGVETVENEAFYQCTATKTIRIPKTLKEWGMSCFYMNSSLEEIHFEDGLEIIDGYAVFGAAPKVKSLTIPASVNTLGECSLGLMSLESVTFLGDAPQTVERFVFDDDEPNFTIYYDENTAGWDDTPLREYPMKPKQ